MPRTGRFSVEFEVAGQTWLAEFSHRHATTSCPHAGPSGRPLHEELRCTHHDTKGRPEHHAVTCTQPRLVLTCPEPVVHGIEYRETPISKPVMVQHVTTVKLRQKGKPIFLTGSAPCSLKDHYDWRKGLHLALQRALAKGKFVTLERKMVCPHVGMGPMCDDHLPADCPEPVRGPIVIVDSKPLYGEIMAAFYREMQVKAASGSGGTETTITPPEPMKAELPVPQAMSLLLHPFHPRDPHHIIAKNAYTGPTTGANWGAH